MVLVLTKGLIDLKFSQKFDNLVRIIIFLLYIEKDIGQNVEQFRKKFGKFIFLIAYVFMTKRDIDLL